MKEEQLKTIGKSAENCFRADSGKVFTTIYSKLIRD